jgi:hypothetical protein
LALVPVFSTVSVRRSVTRRSTSGAPKPSVADKACLSQASELSSTARLTRSSPAPMRVIGASPPGSVAGLV